MSDELDPEDRSSHFSDLSDEDFVQELRHHLSDRSWSVGHWLELERRGSQLTEHDPELHAALAEERAKLFATVNKVLEPLREDIAAQLAPIQEQFRELAAAWAPRIDLSTVLPSVDLPTLMQPSEVWFEATFPEVVEDDLPRLVDRAQVDALSGQALIDEITEAGASHLEAEAEVQRVQIEAATATVAQLEVLREVRDRIAAGNRRDWYDWLLICLTALAASGAIVAAVASLVS